MNDEELREKIAQALCGARYPFRPGPRPTDNPLDYRDAKAILPIVEAEVRAAKAEAWGAACEAFAWCIDGGTIEDALPYVAQHNPYREEPTR